ncbi:hypothetical protein Cgig2_025368 [Carnegiea gigantea]|uniref:PB1-like domain-containing protein n=1 Tax=Carnegiea gigantea TaxID=171969 RepID=A0A9Q1GP18_9CARY|nr:hypothetical protein Cgig2_025368 [Carnegiea gigantea]
MDDAACKDAPVGGPDDVTLEINYGGVFEKGESGLEYKGGGSRTLWPVDADLLSYFEVKGLAEDGERHWPQHDFPLDPLPSQLAQVDQRRIGEGIHMKIPKSQDKANQPHPKRERGRPRLNPEQPQLQPEIQQMAIPSQAQRGRGRPISRRRGRGLGRGRGRATERGREGERIRTNDNASTSRATSMVDVEAGHFLSQASVGSSCLPQQ